MRIREWSSDVCSSDLLATFNINDIGTRLPHLLAWLEKEQPDIVALQELKTVDAAFPAAELEAVGYGAIWHGQKSWNGVALLARDAMPVESRRGLPGDASDGQSRYIEARSEEHTSELQSLMRISYAVFCLKKKKYKQQQNIYTA